MTRINLIDVCKMTDQHLLAEYRELPRIVNDWKKRYGDIKFYKAIPNKFCLGQGHVKFFRNKIKFLIQRYRLIVDELLKRNFAIKQTSIVDNEVSHILTIDINQITWKPSNEDIEISQQRITEKIKQKPKFYRFYGSTLIT